MNDLVMLYKWYGFGVERSKLGLGLTAMRHYMAHAAWVRTTLCMSDWVSVITEDVEDWLSLCWCRTEVWKREHSTPTRHTRPTLTTWECMGHVTWAQQARLAGISFHPQVQSLRHPRPSSIRTSSGHSCCHLLDVFGLDKLAVNLLIYISMISCILDTPYTP